MFWPARDACMSAILQLANDAGVASARRGNVLSAIHAIPWYLIVAVVMAVISKLAPVFQ
jgi:hypothetical protein